MRLIKLFLLHSLLTASIANAAFIGTNIPSDGDGYSVIIDSQNFSILSSDNGIDDASDDFQSFVFIDVATTNIKVCFDWLYKTYDEDGSFVDDYLDPVGYILNGTKYQLNSEVIAQNGEEIGAGFFTILAGDTFGFYADSIDNVAGRGVLTISNLSITPVPEPELFGLVLTGLGIISFSVRRNRN